MFFSEPKSSFRNRSWSTVTRCGRVSLFQKRSRPSSLGATQSRTELHLDAPSPDHPARRRDSGGGGCQGWAVHGDEPAGEGNLPLEALGRQQPPRDGDSAPTPKTPLPHAGHLSVRPARRLSAWFGFAFPASAFVSAPAFFHRFPLISSEASGAQRQRPLPKLAAVGAGTFFRSILPPDWTPSS